MEDLTKQQVILLTVLLSFVTSIGTGIITVSLLDEAPETVTQTINRVVEKTIENVLPTQTTIKETETQTKVIVEKDDVVSNAISKTSKSLVRVYTVLGEDRAFFSMGVIVRGDGLIAISSVGFVPTYKYLAVTDSKEEINLKASDESSVSEIAFLIADTKEGEEPKKFTVAEVGASNDVKLAQSIINIGGDKNTSIQVGRVSSIPKLKDEDGKEYISSIETDIGSSTLGSVIIDFSGAIIGFNSIIGDAKLNKSFAIAENLIPVKKTVPEAPPTNNNP